MATKLSGLWRNRQFQLTKHSITKKLLLKKEIKTIVKPY